MSTWNKHSIEHIVFASTKDSPNYFPQQPITPPPLTMTSNEASSALEKAQKKFDTFSTTMTVLKNIASVAEVGTEWLPVVGKACGLIAEMLSYAKDIAAGQLSILLLIQKAASFGEEIAEEIKKCDGKVSSAMEDNLRTYQGTLEMINRDLSGISHGNWFAQLLKAKDTEKKIDTGSKALSHCIELFQIKSSIHTDSFLVEFREEWRKDQESIVDIALQKFEEVIEGIHSLHLDNNRLHNDNNNLLGKMNEISNQLEVMDGKANQSVTQLPVSEGHGNREYGMVVPSPARKNQLRVSSMGQHETNEQPPIHIIEVASYAQEVENPRNHVHPITESNATTGQVDLSDDIKTLKRLVREGLAYGSTQ